MGQGLSGAFMAGAEGSCDPRSRQWKSIILRGREAGGWKAKDFCHLGFPLCAGEGAESPAPFVPLLGTVVPRTSVKSLSGD